MRRCLVIDDSPLIRKVARMVLERHRMSVDEADGVDSGLAACKTAKPDVVLLDWHLPGKPSVQFLSGLQSLGLQPKPRVIYCTTDNDPIDVARAMEAGCDDVLIKPFLYSDLEEKLGLRTAPAPAAA